MRRLLLLVVVVAATAVIMGPRVLAQSDPGGLRSAANFLGFGTGCTNCGALVSVNRAGRGGEICRVNSLSGEVSGGGIQFGTSGTRSFADCTAPRAGCDGTFTNCARFVIFEISGEICLDDRLVITSPYLHIAGQTAPSPGIVIRCAQVRFGMHDLLVQHIRFRFNTGIGCLACHDSVPVVLGSTTQWAYNAVFDHVSIAFANGYVSFASSETEGGSQVQPHPWDVSVLDSIVAWPLAVDPDNIYLGYGMAFWPVDNNQITAARNIIVHASHRGLAADKGQVQYVNNFIYGSGWDNTWGAFQAYFISTGSTCDGFGEEGPECKTEYVAINNRFVGSVGTGDVTAPRTSGSQAGHAMFTWAIENDNVNLRGDRVWLSGNDGENETGPSGDNQLADVYWEISTFNNAQIGFGSAPSWHTNMSWTPIATAGLHTSLQATVGARPVDRDNVDALAVSQMVAAAGGTIQGTRIRAPSDLGLTLSWAVNTHTLSTPANPNTVADGAGRTNMELWLESLATTVENGINISSLTPSLGPVGTSVVIAGTGFGATQGPGVVRFNGVTATCSTWTAVSITCTVPGGTTTGNVVVTQLGIASDNELFTVGAEDPPPPIFRLRFLGQILGRIGAWLHG